MMSFKAAGRLQNFSANKIGLRRGEVLLEPHNRKWRRLFSDEAYFVFDELRNETLRLYHCGSTSVQDLDSKPIIDILGSVSSLEELDRQKSSLEEISYEYKGEYGVHGRRYCVLYNPEKTIAYAHLHIFQHGDAEIEKLLQFRDHLRSSLTDRVAYQNQKKYLIDELSIPRDKYSESKSEIIDKIQKAADQKSPTQKVLAVVGAAEGHKNTADFLHDTYAKHQVEVIDLNDSVVLPYSYSQEPSDNFQIIIRKTLDADVLVLATPVYWYSMSGAMKDFMDRFSNLLSGEHKHLGESLYGKKLKLLSTGYDVKLPLGFEVPFSATAIYFGMDYLGANYRSAR